MSAVCSICLDNLSQRCVVYPCCHEFDFACIREWCSGNRKCPVCRLDVKEIMYDIKSQTEYKIWNREAAEYDDEDEDYDDDYGQAYEEQEINHAVRGRMGERDESAAAAVRRALVQVASETDDADELILLVAAIAALDFE